MRCSADPLTLLLAPFFCVSLSRPCYLLSEPVLFILPRLAGFCCSLIFLTSTSCKDMPHVVWSNLKAHNYGDDLTRPCGGDEQDFNVRNPHEPFRYFENVSLYNLQNVPVRVPSPKTESASPPDWPIGPTALGEEDDMERRFIIIHVQTATPPTQGLN